MKLLCELYEISVDALLKDDVRLQEEMVLGDSDVKTEKEGHAKQMEILFVFVIMIVSCLIPFLGVAVSIVVLIHILKNHKEYPIAVKVILTICLTLSLINSFIILNNLYFHIGEATIS